MKILITGFDPFGGASINPSYEAVKRLPDEINGAKIVKLEVPTVAYKSLDKITGEIEKHQPDVVLCIGQAGGRYEITPEKVGINLNDFRIPDNEGNRPLDEKIVEDGENAYFTSLPVKAMVEEMKKASVPASLSYSAGTFVCNHVLYGILHHIKVNNLSIRAGFIHIPFMNEQVIGKKDTPSMSLDTLVLGLTKAIYAITKNKEDIHINGGNIC